MLTIRTRISRRTLPWCKYCVRNVEGAQISVTRWLSFPSEDLVTSLWSVALHYSSLSEEAKHQIVVSTTTNI